MLSNLFSNFFANWKVDVQCHLKNNVFFPGNVVEGVVVINSSSPINFTAIRLKICGKEKVHIRRQTGSGKHRRTNHYCSSNTVLKQLITLAGDLKYGGMKSSYPLPAGRYCYPFAYQLPMDLPPSFMKAVSDDFASIMYYMKAYIDIPMGRDAISKCYFQLIRPIPQSQWIMRNPIGVNRTFHVTMCCCIDKGNVIANVSMDRSIVVIDRDWLQVFAAIDNRMGKEPVLNLEVSLRHTCRYMARGVTETNVYTAGKRFVGTQVPAGQQGIISGVVDLPRNLMPSFMTPNIHSQYQITIELNIPWATDPCIAFPVFIAQSVDESNFTPPVMFDALGGTRYTPGRMQCPEYYYCPPQNPVFAFQPLPTFAPPPHANFLPPVHPNNQLMLPSNQWAQNHQPPPAEGAPQKNPMQLQWQPGYGQVHAPHIPLPPPPTEPMVGPGADAMRNATNTASPPHSPQQQQQQPQQATGYGYSNNGAAPPPALHQQQQQYPPQQQQQQQQQQQYLPQQQQYPPQQQQQQQQQYNPNGPQLHQGAYGAPPPTQQQHDDLAAKLL